MKNIRIYIILFSLLGWLPIAATAQNVVKGTVTLDDVEIEAEYKLIGDYAVLGSGYNACIPQYSEGKVVVPATITYNDYEYAVNEVSNVAFRMCSKITEVVLPENIYDIGNFAFQGCQALTKVTLPSTLASLGTGAFIDLPNLTTIDLKAQTPPQWLYNDVFKFHTGGIGDNATYTYEIQLLVPEGKVDTYKQKLYSDYDLGWTKPEGWGNFTNIDIGAATNAEAYATYHNGTLTFYYDTHRTDRESNGLTTYGIADYGVGDLPAWLTPISGHANDITRVEFTPLFQYARPVTTAKWFSGCANLNTIIGMSHLRTDEVTDMSFMFNGCSSLNDDDFDFSQFNTASVTTMRNLFYGCTGIQQPDLSHFDTRNCTNMQDMFWGCTGLTSIDLSSFETTACNFNYMFSGCTNLEAVSIGSLGTESEGVCVEMFRNCSKLSTLVIPSSFNKLNMAFNGCTSLYDVYCYKPMPFEVWQGCGSDFYTTIPYYTRFHVLESALEAWETAYGQNSATPANVQFIGDLGTETNPILIYGTADWVNVGLMTDNDIRVNAKMMNDIGVTTMLGTSSLQPFKGVFDGNGHTLTVNYEITGEQTMNDFILAPFSIIQNAEIKNLKVEGNITVTATDGRIAAAGLVGWCMKISDSEEVNNTITNCHVSTHVFGNIANLGGVVAFIDSHATTTISGCYFDGSLATPHEYNWDHAAYAGAIVCTHGEPYNITIVDCVEDGSYADTDTKTFAQNITPTNSYRFTSDLTGQAKLAYSLTTDTEGLVLDFGTPTATYDVSGITAYATGLKLDNIFHAGTNQPVNVAITAPGYEYSISNLSITGGAGLTTTDDVNYIVTLHDADAVVSLPGMVFTTIMLYDDARDNTLTLENYIDQTYKVQLAGHTIHKNAQWNMLCLPFDLPNLNGTPLQGAHLRELEDITFENKVAVFHFKFATSISADKLYLVKVDSDIEDPIFDNVTIKRSLPPGLKKEVGELTHSGFVANGNYNKVGLKDFDEEENLYTALYFDGTSLRKVKNVPLLNAFQGYFEVCVNIDMVVAIVLDIEDSNNFFRILDDNIDNIDNIFITNGDWNEDDNWASGAVPSGTNRNVLIEGRATIPSDYRAEVGNIIIDRGNLTIKSGGQLVHANESVQAIVEKDIAPYTNDDDGWNFIASPLSYTITPVQENGFLTTDTYDLYYLEEASSIWRNYKAHSGFYIDPQKGYLYANSEGTTLQFAGTLQHYVEQGIPIQLNHEGEGWNLVGNPFAFAAYPDKPYYIINGRNVEATESGEAIAPCTGIVVKAESDDPEWVTFTKDAPTQASAHAGSLHIVLAQANDNRSTSKIDNAIVSFNSGSVLPKFHFGDNAEIYLPKGNEDYAIVFSNKQGEMPLNFKANENGTYTLTITAELPTENCQLTTVNYLHLIDNITGADIDLLQTPSYMFTGKTDDYASRFKLVFAANAEDGPSTSETFAFISNGNLIVNGKGTLQVVDVMGRAIRTVGLSQCGNRTTTAGMHAGVYVLRLINGKDVKTQKIIIEY